MIKIVLVDDEPLIRTGLRTIFEATGEIEVIGEAGSGRTAVMQAQALQPDVVCMDIRMPDGDGLSATREIGRFENPPAVIVITTFDMDEYVFGALEAGACGVLLKDSPMDDLIEGVKRAATGEGMVDSTLTRRVIAEFSRRGTIASHPAPRVAEDEVAPASVLTERELDCIRELGKGLTNIEIAQALFLEPSTVKTHLSSAMGKVGASSRVKLVIWAFRAGVVA